MDPEHEGCKSAYRLLKKLTKRESQAATAEKSGRYEEALLLVHNTNHLHHNHTRASVHHRLDP